MHSLSHRVSKAAFPVDSRYDPVSRFNLFHLNLLWFCRFVRVSFRVFDSTTNPKRKCDALGPAWWIVRPSTIPPATDNRLPESGLLNPAGLPAAPLAQRDEFLHQFGGDRH